MGEPPAKKKCFNDPIHKHIDLHTLLVQFINTPQFQRLKNIKQLGGNYYLYPGASHNRFEHSIGVCHLAGELVRHLQSTQPELNIDEKDVLCVELAGLCHDLGHGPFSHMFDHHFLKEIEETNQDEYWEINNHEERSYLMFERILQDERNDDVKKEFRRRLGCDQDGSYFREWRNVVFIKEMINANQEPSPEIWKYKGRSRDKSFLYEIVANKRNGVDVDKWDYFARDCHQLGISNSFDHVRFMKNMKVLKRCTRQQQCDSGSNESNNNDAGDENDIDLQICARDKECKNLYEMFHTRDALHRRAYQHTISTAVEAMICDAMVLANDYITFKGRDGQDKTMAKSIDHMEAFEKITDNIIEQIRHSNDSDNASERERGNMKKAREILNRVSKHDYYIYLGNKIVPQDVATLHRSVEIKYAGKKIPKAKTVKEKIKKWKDEERKSFEEIFGQLAQDNCILREKKFDYGKKDEDPVDKFLFYSKEQPSCARPMNQEERFHMLPRLFMDVVLEVYCKKKELKVECEAKFKEWKELIH